ncbi:alpha/beta hydrolase [Mesorhizobium sp. BAC0120]|uniref:alpha/beta hydrolase n=1 Tax=Mesorhizobium sp. BAC0120 TaxID=3090670 RepID=UPI00298CBFB7|nr:alpha/beta hydrolase [Mesorhizobium sp. BAC0120]MDW6025040.1 alpha/beta hydrolase [Mesorhizobium sp. BAC0120]
MQSILHETPGNPAPEKPVAGFLATRDGLRLRYAHFAATSRPLNGTVVVLPGRNECIEKYFETIRDLNARGLGVAIIDWRGQGESDRMLKDPERGYVDSFRDYVRDLEQFFQQIVLPDCRGPFYMLGHSTGAVIALLSTPSMVNRLRRMVLIAPPLAIAGFPFSMRTIHRMASTLYAAGLGGMYMGGGRRPREAKPFSTNVLTTDRRRYMRNQSVYETWPQLALGGPTVAWVRAACIASEAVQGEDFIARLQIPTLFIAAGADAVVSTPAIERYARRIRSASVLTIDGSRHEILQEADIYREQFLAAFDAFVPGSEV